MKKETKETDEPLYMKIGAVIFSIILAIIFIIFFSNQLANNSGEILYKTTPDEANTIMQYYNASCGCIHCFLNYCNKYKQEVNQTILCG